MRKIWLLAILLIAGCSHNRADRSGEDPAACRRRCQGLLVVCSESPEQCDQKYNYCLQDCP